MVAMSNTESLRYDVLVLGTGVAGLSAALSAAQSGASVGVAERAPRGEHGGNTRYTEAFLRMKSVEEVSDDFVERFIDESGYHLDPEVVNDAMSDRPSGLAAAQPFLEPRIIDTFASEAGPTLRWMTENGVRFAEASTPFLTSSTTRLAPVGGGLAIVEALTPACEAAGVDIRFETVGRELRLDEQGQVIGVRAVHEGRSFDITAGSVILACGGFEGNPEMQARYIERAAFTRPVARGGYYNRGEGIAMALRAGAAGAGDFALFHAEPVDPRSGAPEAAIFAFTYGILVNQEGQRFVDEATGTSDATYEAVTRQILRQPGGLAYVIFDDRLDDVPNWRSALRTDQPAIVADTIEELAGKLKVPTTALIETVEVFNRACPDAAAFRAHQPDGLATSNLVPPKSNWARTVENAPFAAYPVMASNVFTFGGLKTTEHGQVVSSEGAPMRGLYAAGEVMGIFFGRYTGSTSVLRGAVFGRLAGLHAAAATTSEADAETDAARPARVTSPALTE